MRGIIIIIVIIKIIIIIIIIVINLFKVDTAASVCNRIGGCFYDKEGSESVQLR